MSTQILQKNPSDLRCSQRTWKVTLIGEGADDAGGVFDETMAQMCEVHELLIIDGMNNSYLLSGTGIRHFTSPHSHT